MSTIRLPPYRVVTSTAQAGSARTSPMIQRILTTFRSIESIQSSIGIFRRNNGKKLTFIRDMQGVKPKQFARAADLVAHGNLLLQ